MNWTATWAKNTTENQWHFFSSYFAFLIFQIFRFGFVFCGHWTNVKAIMWRAKIPNNDINNKMLLSIAIMIMVHRIVATLLFTNCQCPYGINAYGRTQGTLWDCGYIRKFWQRTGLILMIALKRFSQWIIKRVKWVKRWTILIFQILIHCIKTIFWLCGTIHNSHSIVIECKYTVNK